jgi:hypothetical protein
VRIERAIPVIKMLAQRDGVAEAEIIENWEEVLIELSRTGINVGSVVFDLQQLKAEYSQIAKQGSNNKKS